MSDEEKGLPKQTIRPNPEPATASDEGMPHVSEKADLKRKAIFFVAALGLFVAFMGLRHCSKDEKTPVSAESVASSDKPDYHKTTDSEKPQVSALTGKPLLPSLIETDTKPAVDVELRKRQLALLDERMKMNKLRRASSIEFHINTDSVPSQAAAYPTQATVSSTASGRKLPLNAEQIDALKRAQGGTGSNEAFQSNVENSTVVHARATKIQDLSDTITQGTLISGVLQTAINSDLPGMIKANVSEDVYSFDSKKLLIPKGSVLVGQYSAGIVMGQKRALVMWSRVIRADGVDVMLGSPGTDSLGSAGLGADVVETHFWERFGQASLLSIIGTGIATAGVDQDAEYNSTSAYRMMMASNFQSTANSSLASTLNKSPTLKIFQGTKINVFVNRDISFHAVNLEDGV